MSYTIAELDDAIENEENEWGGSWHEFEEAIDSTHDLVPAEPNEPGAHHATWFDPPRWEKWVDKAEPGVELPGIGRATIVESFGGEGKGDDYWLVFRVTDADGEERLFRRNGWYASYDGGEYDGPTHEVVEAQQLITVYNKI